MFVRLGERASERASDRTRRGGRTNGQTGDFILILSVRHIQDMSYAAKVISNSLEHIQSSVPVCIFTGQEIKTKASGVEAPEQNRTLWSLTDAQQRSDNRLIS